MARKGYGKRQVPHYPDLAVKVKKQFSVLSFGFGLDKTSSLNNLRSVAET